MGQKRPFRSLGAMSALPPKADIRADEIEVRFVPLATKLQRSRMLLFDHPVGRAVRIAARYVTWMLSPSR